MKPRLGSLLTTMIMIVSTSLAQEPENAASIEEQLKYSTSKLNTISALHSMEMVALRKEIENLREEVKSCMSCNEKKNSQITLEWAMGTVAELRKEMRELEAANNASGWQQDLRNEVAAILAEAEGVTKLAAADGARLAACEARHAELMLDVRQIRDMATSAKVSCDVVGDDIKKLQSDMKTQYRILNKKLYLHTRDEYPTVTNDMATINYNDYKVRHVHSLREQIELLKRDNHKVYAMQRHMKAHMKSLHRSVETLLESKIVHKLQKVVDEHEKHSILIRNITSEVENFNKLHASVLELLENMEELENKVDKTVPDLRKEISKLDVDVAQIRSHNSYLKDDQENIRQSMKAVAVTVSNLVDKFNEDHSTLNNYVSAVKKIQGQNLKINTESSTMKDYANTKSHPKSCDEIKDFADDSYLILPDDGEPISTKCTEGWTLIQNRFNGSVDFNKKYAEYSKGFGTPLGEFWIGNDALHRLTSDNCSSLRINMLDIYGKYWQANYEYFNIGSSYEGYRLKIGGFSGNVSNALEYQNGMQFSAVDEDRDISKNNCAANYEGGWWFSHCQHANLNGKYALGLTWFNAAQNEWIALSSSSMMIRKRDKCIGDSESR